MGVGKCPRVKLIMFEEGNPGFLLNTQPIISILDYGGNTLQANPKPSGDTNPCRMT